jgi:integrase
LLKKKDLLPITDRYEEDIENFMIHLVKENTPPKTITSIRGVLRVFFRNSRIDLDDIVWEDLRRHSNGNQVRTQDKPIDTEILEKILIQGNVKSKSFFLILASSGMRVGELTQIKLNNVEFGNPTKIEIPADITKTKTRRYTYISNEATRYLKEWLKIRDEYIKQACKKSNKYEKNPDDDRVYPFDKSVAQWMWNVLIRKSGYNQKDEKTGRYVYHIHGLRKFFRSYFPNTDIAETLMGHEGYLTASYRRLSEEKIRKSYLNGMPSVTVFDRMMTDSEQQEIIDKQQEEIDTLKKQMKDILAYQKALEYTK